MIEAIIVAAIAGGFGIVLTFIFTRNREVTSMAHQVVASTHTYFNVIETLKTVAFIQSQRIDAWERAWAQAEEYNPECKWDEIDHPEMHLDLRTYWRDIDKAVTEMQTPLTKAKRKVANANKIHLPGTGAIGLNVDGAE